jgi:6-hydroxycyclohex-1-ene-1-carbonyl-CoA dehydrogenase
MIPSTIKTWQMTVPGTLTKTEIPVPQLQAGRSPGRESRAAASATPTCPTSTWACRTDHPPPLSLGHEISGVVVAGEASYIGKEVIIPAVLPCNKCELCKTGRGNRCLAQKMPGNSMGIYGGFSSHIRCRRPTCASSAIAATCRWSTSR